MECRGGGIATAGESRLQQPQVLPTRAKGNSMERKRSHAQPGAITAVAPRGFSAGRQASGAATASASTWTRSHRPLYRAIAAACIGALLHASCGEGEPSASATKQSRARDGAADDAPEKADASD